MNVMKVLVYLVQTGLIILKLMSYIDWPWPVVLIIWESFGTVVLVGVIGFLIWEKLDPKGFSAWQVRRAIKEVEKRV